MSRYNGEAEPVFGARKTINITVISNDAPFGVFMLDATNRQLIMGKFVVLVGHITQA